MESPGPTFIDKKTGDDLKVRSLEWQVQVRLKWFAVTLDCCVSKADSNIGKAPVEGEITFPLSSFTAVAGFALSLEDDDGSEPRPPLVPAVITGKEKAQEAFENATRAEAPGKIGTLEHVSGNVYRARVYPINRRGRRFRLSIVGELRDATDALRLPLRLPLSASAPSAYSCIIDVHRAPIAGDPDTPLGQSSSARMAPKLFIGATAAAGSPSSSSSLNLVPVVSRRGPGSFRLSSRQRLSHATVVNGNSSLASVGDGLLLQIYPGGAMPESSPLLLLGARSLVCGDFATKSIATDDNADDDALDEQALSSAEEFHFALRCQLPQRLLTTSTGEVDSGSLLHFAVVWDASFSRREKSGSSSISPCQADLPILIELLRQLGHGQRALRVDVHLLRSSVQFLRTFSFSADQSSVSAHEAELRGVIESVSYAGGTRLSAMFDLLSAPVPGAAGASDGIKFYVLFSDGFSSLDSADASSQTASSALSENAHDNEFLRGLKQTHSSPNKAASLSAFAPVHAVCSARVSDLPRLNQVCRKTGGSVFAFATARTQPSSDSMNALLSACRARPLRLSSVSIQSYDSRWALDDSSLVPLPRSAVDSELFSMTGVLRRVKTPAPVLNDSAPGSGARPNDMESTASPSQVHDSSAANEAPSLDANGSLSSSRSIIAIAISLKFSRDDDDDPFESTWTAELNGSALTLVSHRLVSTHWAARRQAELQNSGKDPDEVQRDLLSLGRQFGLVTPGLSMLVLDRLSQYIKYDVEPPKSLPFHEEWVRSIEKQREYRRNQRVQHLTKLNALLGRRQQWWIEATAPLLSTSLSFSTSSSILSSEFSSSTSSLAGSYSSVKSHSADALGDAGAAGPLTALVRGSQTTPDARVGTRGHLLHHVNPDDRDALDQLAALELQLQSPLESFISSDISSVNQSFQTVSSSSSSSSSLYSALPASLSSTTDELVVTRPSSLASSFDFRHSADLDILAMPTVDEIADLTPVSVSAPQSHDQAFWEEQGRLRGPRAAVRHPRPAEGRQRVAFHLLAAEQSYKAAFAEASESLPPTHPQRLQVATDMSELLYASNRPEAAVAMATEAFDSAISQLDCLAEDSYRDSTLQMQVLRDNVMSWTSSSDAPDVPLTAAAAPPPPPLELEANASERDRSSLVSRGKKKKVARRTVALSSNRRHSIEELKLARRMREQSASEERKEEMPMEEEEEEEEALDIFNADQNEMDDIDSRELFCSADVSFESNSPVYSADECDDDFDAEPLAKVADAEKEVAEPEPEPECEREPIRNILNRIRQKQKEKSTESSVRRPAKVEQDAPVVETGRRIRSTSICLEIASEEAKPKPPMKEKAKKKADKAPMPQRKSGAKMPPSKPKPAPPLAAPAPAQGPAPSAPPPAPSTSSMQPFDSFDLAFSFTDESESRLEQAPCVKIAVDRKSRAAEAPKQAGRKAPPFKQLSTVASSKSIASFPPPPPPPPLDDGVSVPKVQPQRFGLLGEISLGKRLRKAEAVVEKAPAPISTDKLHFALAATLNCRRFTVECDNYDSSDDDSWGDYDSDSGSTPTIVEGKLDGMFSDDGDGDGGDAFGFIAGKRGDLGVGGESGGYFESAAIPLPPPSFEPPESALLTSAADVWAAGRILLQLAQGEIRSSLGTSPVRDSNRWSSDFLSFFALCFESDPSSRASAQLLLCHPFLKGVASSFERRSQAASLFTGIVVLQEAITGGTTSTLVTLRSLFSRVHDLHAVHWPDRVLPGAGLLPESLVASVAVCLFERLNALHSNGLVAVSLCKKGPLAVKLLPPGLLRIDFGARGAPHLVAESEKGSSVVVTPRALELFDGQSFSPSALLAMSSYAERWERFVASLQSTLSSEQSAPPADAARRLVDCYELLSRPLDGESVPPHCPPDSSDDCSSGTIFSTESNVPGSSSALNGDVVTVITTSAELALSDARSLRMLAMACGVYGLNEIAVSLLERVLVLRSEEPISRIQLANALMDAWPDDEQQVRRATSLLAECASLAADARFSQVELLALVELQRCMSHLQARFGANLLAEVRTVEESVDEPFSLLKEHCVLLSQGLSSGSYRSQLRIVCTWNADECDVELHVTEPSGERVHAFCNHSSSGAQLSRDVTDGYGPEVYELCKPPLGDYHVAVRLFNKGKALLAGDSVCCRIRIYTDYGSPESEKCQSAIVFLNKEREFIHVAKVSISKK